MATHQTAWAGGLNYCKADKVQENIFQVKLDSNFQLPIVPCPTICGFRKDLPEDHLDVGGLCLCVRFQQQGSTEEKNYVDLLKTIAGRRESAEPGKQGGEYAARHRLLVRISIGREANKREFLGIGPQNPELIDSTFVLRCYQATSDLSPPPPPSTRHAANPLPAIGPPLARGPYTYAQPYPYGHPGLPPHGPHPLVGHPWPAQHWPAPYPPSTPAPSWAPGLDSLPAVKQEDSGASSSGMADHKQLPPALTRTNSGAQKVHKSMLKTWAQHHPFLFGAIAELVDNSYDQGSTLVELKCAPYWLCLVTAEIDAAGLALFDQVKVLFRVSTGWGKPVLTIKDNGNGMEPDNLRRMLSIGHPRDPFNKEKLGKYGVGFKQGSMRIGENAVVISKRGAAVCVGLISQEYHSSLAEDANLDLPMLFYKFPSLQFDLEQHTKEEARAVLDILARFSPFNEMKLGMEIERLGEHGTTVHIWDLSPRAPTAGNQHPYELQWGKKDIILTSKKKERRPGNFAKQMPIDWSLRAYMQLLYFGNRHRDFKIRIQERMVESGTAFTAKSLQKLSKMYKKDFPVHYEQDVPGMDEGMSEKAKLIFGFSQSHADDNNGGVCIYWRGRLIKSFDTMDMMTQKDFGVIGLCSTGSILNVINNKQDFQTNLESWEAVEAWIQECFRHYKETILQREVLEDIKNCQEKVAKWAYCDSCGKARKLPKGYSVSDNDDTAWYCWDLPEDNPFRDCSVPQEAHNDDEVTVSTKNAGVTYKGTKSGRHLQASGDGPKPKKQKTDS